MCRGRHVAELILQHGAPVLDKSRGQGHVVIGRNIPVVGSTKIGAVRITIRERGVKQP